MSMLPKSETGRKATAMVLWGAITMTIGYGFMRLTTPTDEEIYARLSPELRRQFDRTRAASRERNDAALQQVFDLRNLDRPAWRTDVPADTRRRTSPDAKQEVPLSLDSDALVPPSARGTGR